MQRAASLTRCAGVSVSIPVSGKVAYSGFAPKPRIEIAQAVIEGLAGGPMNPGLQPELTILPLDAGGYALTYTGRVFTGADLRVYFIDAHTGGLVQEFSGLFKQDTVGTGHGVHGDNKKISVTPSADGFIANDQLRPIDVQTYDMKGDLERVKRVLNGSLALRDSELAGDADNVWDDPVEVDGHVYSGWMYDYVFRHFGRRSSAGNLRILTLVHPVNRDTVLSASPEDQNLFFLNAFFCPACSADGNGVMVYGEGLPPGFTVGGSQVGPYAGALDIVSHELTHLVADISSGLGIRNEAGALNEAFADIMGAAVEFFFQSPGDGPLKADYLIGEDVASPLLAGVNRSLADPQRFGDPDHLSKFVFGTADNGGVHTNSLIASHAYYLAIEGGTNRTSGLMVQGVGSAQRIQMTEVFYRTLRDALPSNATFSLALAATIQTARDLDPSGGLASSLTQAWDAVGVK